MKKLLALLLLAGAVSLQAADQTITFAVPEVDGTISLGVYDSNKKLVRTLATNATDKDFKIGLNGLIKVWDGKNDAGQPLPAGKYDVKGYVVPDAVKAEGEAFHFNDWVVDEDDPMLKSPRVIWAKGPEIYLLGEGVVVKYSTRGNLELVKDLPTSSRFLGGDGSYALLESAAPNGLVGIKLSDSSNSFPASEGWGANSSSAAIWNQKIYVSPTSESKNSRLVTFPLADDVNEIESPQNIRLLDSNEGALIASDEKSVWFYRGQTFDPVPLGQDVKINSLSAGAGETFWVVGQPVENGQPGPTFVRQYSFTGEVLRQIAGELPATTIFADKTENRIYLTHVEGATTTIKGLRPVEAKTDAAPAATATPAPVATETEAPKTADWEVFLEKTSTLCPKFGLVDGKLVADAGDAEQKTSHRFDLPPSTMDQQQHTLTVHLKAKDGEIWATGTGGLKLALVGKLPGVDRVVVAPGEKQGQLKVYAGNGVVVAEYLLSGLDEIAQINAGEIELP